MRDKDKLDLGWIEAINSEVDCLRCSWHWSTHRLGRCCSEVCSANDYGAPSVHVRVCVDWHDAQV